jgi:hypothetical protein
MPDSTSVQPILDAAEQAAAAGDIGAAEKLLRRAVRLQETQLGPQHPDLANTLNNLGVMCETAGRLDEAERCYRRGYEIAAARFEPDHPFVITSRKNLADFCEARGKPLELPVALAAATPDPPQAAVSPPTAAPPAGEDVAPAAKPPEFQIALSSPLMIALVALLVLPALGVLLLMRSSGREESPMPDAAPTAQAPIESVTLPSAAASAAPVATDPPGPAERESAPPSATPDVRPAPEGGASTTRPSAQPNVVLAQVCRRFSTADSPDWRCEPAGASVGPGSLVYYTRIKAASPTTVEHRWYHGDDLQQSVRLRVAANQTAGYRTFSRLTIGAAGPWRVELRTTSGTLLHEERFNVR